MDSGQGKIRPYSHFLGEEVRSIAGGYTLEKEERLEMDGRTVLYVVGNASVDSSCCGVGGCRFANVPGYLEKERVERDENGCWVSLVEPITDPDIQKTIEAFLKKKELVQQVRFD